MNAIFKGNNKIIVNGADSSEKILLEDFCNSLTEDKEVKLTKLYDINGVASGLAIEIVDKPTPEEPEEVNDGE